MAWAGIKSREDWEKFRDEKIALLFKSLGQFQQPPASLKIETTGSNQFAQAGFVIENVIYETRPQLWVSANLYRPINAPESAPGILISHAHHTPKEHTELQDMGMMWARAGCYVLVPDHFGHGERRQHPFIAAESYPGAFRVGRQDYYFRYDSGIKLHLLGESLMGWLSWDLSRGVDCLLQQPGIDRSRIILLGAVAGGGDPCAVTAALDKRITAAVPFNFGGPQPETRYPLPDDAETSFNYAGSGSWESTRNLTRSAKDGFLPWVIVGSSAPRKLVVGHEFEWDQARDPVWKRLQTIYEFFGAPSSLSFTHGRGGLRGQPPEATHCTHIGSFHRQRIHQAFRQWFQIDVPLDSESAPHVQAATLRCFPADSGGSNSKSFAAFDSIAQQRVAIARRDLQSSPAQERRVQLQSRWTHLLGQVAADIDIARPAALNVSVQTIGNIRAERIQLSTDTGIQVPLVFLHSANLVADRKLPVVLVASHAGKGKLIQDNVREYTELIDAGFAVCIPDLRGTGESQVDPGRGRTSSATSISSSLLMFGDPLIAGQLRDLRAVFNWLCGRSDVDLQHIKIWGDSRSTRAADENAHVMPRDDDSALPPSVEPAGCMLALLLALYEDSIESICLSGGLSCFADVMNPLQVRIVHDCVVPGLLTAGDMEDLIAQVAERMPVRVEGMVNGLNIALSDEEVRQTHARVEGLRASREIDRLTSSREIAAVDWLLNTKALSRKQ